MLQVRIFAAAGVLEAITTHVPITITAVAWVIE
jgi:hypothetical protein